MIIRFHPVNQYTRSTKKVPWLTDWATSSSVDNGPAIICRPHNGCHGWGRRIANVRRTLYWTFKLASLQFWIKKRIWAACQDFGTLLNPILTVVIAFARRKGPPTCMPILIKREKPIVWAQNGRRKGIYMEKKDSPGSSFRRHYHHHHYCRRLRHWVEGQIHNHWPLLRTSHTQWDRNHSVLDLWWIW